MAAKNVDPLSNGISNNSLETSAQDWNFSCGVCHVGGGQMEYDRNRNSYSASSPSGDANFYSYMNGSIVPGFMSNTNKAEVDCLLCHLNDNSGMSGNGRAWLQSMGCGTMALGPINDPTCTGVSGIPGVPAAGPFTAGTKYDMYNRNLALKLLQFDWAASLGIGATVTWDLAGNPTGISGMPSGILAEDIQATPNSQNCSVCHARDDNTPGLPGMINMKYGYGNYAMISPAGTAADIDKAADLSVANDVLWFELGCKTGMGKRAHRIGQGPNANWGMSMFNVMFNLGKYPGDPVTNQAWDFSSMGMGTLTVKERQPDIDVHDAGGMQCATCHYALGSTSLEGGSITIPAGTHHGVAYPAETILGIDHQFAQSDSLKDTYGKNNLDGTISCESCHTTRTHPRLTDNGGTLVAPTPTHAGFPSVHMAKIGCTTCHIPETYSAPGRLKYRDHSVGYYKKGEETNGGFRNMLDWNYDLITGSHKPVPSLHVWATKEGESKIYPVLPSEMPIWVKGNGGTAVESGSEAGVSADLGGKVCAGGLKVAVACTADADCPGSTCIAVTNSAAYSPAPSKSRDVILAARASEVAGVLRRANTINGGNMVPLFDGFSLADAWSVDTAARQADMSSRGAGAKLKVFHAAFDVTHGVVAKEWALGGSKRGGCVSCHSSIDKMARNAYGQPTGPNPNYSPNSIGFFESYQQPLEGTNYSFGVGQYDMLKNWFSLFADYDCTMMCGGGMQPDSTYFDPAGNPLSGAACGDPFGMGWTNLGNCVSFMTDTFDQAMGFPGGTAMLMGMYDGIAGLQGFVVRETVSGATLGCQPFAGPANSPVAQAFGVNVNKCMPAAFSGACTGPQTNPMWPASCVGGFRNGQGCAMNNDCQGALTDATEVAKNPNGLIYSRNEVRKQFKITLQNAGKLTWPIAVEKNPSNPSHVASWDQANNCVTNMGTPVACGTAGNPMCAFQDGTANSACINVRTWINGNELLGYTSNMVSELTNINLTTGNAGSVPVTSETNCTACHNGSTISPRALNHSPVSGLIGGLSDATSCKTCHLAGGQTVHTGAVVDVQLACGQCHGGSNGPAGTANGAPYFSNASIAQYASVMHGGAATGGPVSPPVVKTADQCTSGSSPLAVGSVDVTDATVGQLITLDTTGTSADVAVFINWGDGSALATGVIGANTHAYGHIGRYQVVQTVKNACGFSAQNVLVVNVTGGTGGKGMLTIDMAGTAGLNFSYSVMNSGSSTSITNGHITIAGSKTITLDAGTYDVKIGYPSVMPLTDPLTYHSCDIVAGGTAIGITGQLITGLVVNPGVATTVSLTNCN